MAEACGVRGLRVERPEEVRGAVSEALHTPGPVLVEAVVDPFEPLMPGTVKPEQAEKFAEALRRGQPNRQKIALTLYRDAIEDFEENATTLMSAIQGEVSQALDQRNGGPDVTKMSGIPSSRE